MKRTLFLCLLVYVLGIFTPTAHALTVTLDLNGFISPGGSVTGEGIKNPIPIPATDQLIKLSDLKAGMTYYVDFFHNTGDDSSDFYFTINNEGTGVSFVSMGGGRHTMVTGFAAGATTLKLNTFTATFNPDRAQTGAFSIVGMTKGKVGPNSTPVVAKLIPGIYSVENFGGPPGAEVYEFIVDSKGKVAPKGSADEYAAFVDSTIKPRVCKVHFKIAASAPIQYNVSHPISSITSTKNNNEFDLAVPVGGGGVTVTTFGPCRVSSSNVVLPHGTPFKGTTSDDAITFNPRVCFDSRRGFFFETERGPTTSVMADVTGQMKDKQTQLNAKFTATIVPAKATPPPAGSGREAPRSKPVSTISPSSLTPARPMPNSAQ